MRVFTSLVTWSLELLDLLLKGPDVHVLLLDAEYQLHPGPVEGHLIEVLVLHILLVLPHSVHLLQHVLGPDNENGVNCNKMSVVRAHSSHLDIRVLADWSCSLSLFESLLASVRSCWTGPGDQPQEGEAVLGPEAAQL